MKAKRIFFVLLTLYFSISFSSKSFGQLIVDAGKDTIVCSGNTDDEGIERIKIGGNPTASGGVGPYKFTWSGKRKIYPSSKYMLYASDILEDTTQCNPTFKRNSAPEDWFTFHLKVEDASNHIGYDSVRIRSSRFITSLVSPRMVGINLGDSVRLFGNAYIGGNFPLLRYFISPSHGLSDSTDIYGWAKPKRNIRYYLQAVDSIGCICWPVPHLDIHVDTTATSNEVLASLKTRCFFDSGDLIISVPQKQGSPYQVTVTAVDGGIVHSGKYCDRNLRITNLKLKENQIYLITILDGNKRQVFKLLYN
ncbi:MAG: hypothetical protein Q8P34_18410 [Bacteroidota bacterium]|nr:hypothetical protein [Bacteroidota bacterium]